MQRYHLVVIHEDGTVQREAHGSDPDLDRIAALIDAPGGHIRTVLLRGLTDIPMWCEDCAEDIDIPFNVPVNQMIDRELQRGTFIRGRLVLILDRQHASWDWGQNFLRGIYGWSAYYREQALRREADAIIVANGLCFTCGQPDDDHADDCEADVEESPDWMKGMDEDEYDSWAAGMSAWAKSLKEE